jgi:NAD(P)-dependent dehydrogenase (short-subunit alcohol dehydrogenase family)
MKDKIVLITGATSGIGEATALELAGLGAEVVITYRNPTKFQATQQSILAVHPGAKVTGMQVDLEDLASVRKMAAAFQQKYSRLDVLINNAGAIFTQRGTTKDGFERTFGLNHLAHFVLTLELMPLLKASAPARIINVSSAAQSQGRLNFGDLMGEKSYSGFRAYCQSKLANVVFTYDLAQRLRDANITVHALHPGVVATGFGLNTEGFLAKLVRLGQALMIRPEKGAQTSVFLATDPTIANQTGMYWAKCKPRRTRPESYERSVQQQLWQESERLTGSRWPAN